MMATIRRLWRLPAAKPADKRARLDNRIAERLQANREAREAVELAAQRTTDRYRFALAEAAKMMREG